MNAMRTYNVEGCGDDPAVRRLPGYLGQPHHRLHFFRPLGEPVDFLGLRRLANVLHVELAVVSTGRHFLRVNDQGIIPVVD